jgi:4'-phosphopantetheinyl transferase
MDDNVRLPLLSLPDHEVHLWYVFVDRITDPETLRAYEAVLSPDEEARYRRFAFVRNGQQFLVGRALVRTTLSCYADVPPADWVFAAGVYGKPEIARPEAFAKLCFNLAHTDGLVACAVAACEVGVDVEEVNRRNVSADLARYCLSAAELAHWESLPDEERREVFFDYWTLKEAYSKARGLGLSVPLHAFSFELHADKPPTLSLTPESGEDPKDWQFARLRPSRHHRAAVAIRRTDGRDVALVVQATVPPCAEAPG